MRIRLDILQLVAFLPVIVECGPWCFKCDNVFHPAACQEVIACGEHEYCYTEKHSNNNGAELFSSGCKPMADCPAVVRRSILRSSVVRCEECCSTTLCNEVLCNSESYSNHSRVWCADCQLQQDPSACDHVTICSQDESCSLTKKSVFGHQTYDLGCESKQICQGKTLATDNQQCCSSHLCNTNLAGVSPDLLTSPPPSTTTPTPAPASATLNQTNIDFVSHHLGNETLELTCLLSGFPVPNITWFFTPYATSGNGTCGGNATTGSASAGGNVTVGSNSTTGNSTGGNSTASCVTTVEITSGVTTIGMTSTLVVNSPDGGDAGEYVCHVANSLGSGDSAVSVTFKAVPKIAGPSNETIQSDVRDDVLLVCDVDGTPPPDVEWQVPQTAGGVDYLSNGLLLLHNVHGDNSGVYECVANNTAGQAVKTFDLAVKDNSTAPCPTVSSLITSLLTTRMTTTVPSTSTTSQATTTTTTTSPPPTITCPTLPPTTTPTSTTMTTTPTTTTASTTTTPSTTTTTTTASTTNTPSTTTMTTTTPTTTATTPTTTPTTTTTTPSTTTPTTTTSPTTMTTTTTTPTTTTSPTTTSASTASTTTGPLVTADGTLFRDSNNSPVLLVCRVHAPPGMTSPQPVTWSRLERDYDHTDTRTYIEDGHGVLVITPQHPHVTNADGVYKCHLATGSANDKAEFVVYTEVPGPIDCRQEFKIGAPAVGMVFRTTCGPCQRAPMQTSQLIWRDQICNSAVGRKVIPETGGTVTWLLKSNNEVDLLTEENGHVIHTS